MQERALPRGWIERSSSERRRDADTPIRVLESALCAYSQPTASALAQRGIWVAISLGILSKPNRSRSIRSLQTSPTK